MLYILFGIILAIILIVILFLISANDNYNDIICLITGTIGGLLSIATAVTIIIYCFTVWSWISAEHKANIINREYHTNYTREEIFYASNVIDTIRQLDRKRIEVNGDVLKVKE